MLLAVNPVEVASIVTLTLLLFVAGVTAAVVFGVLTARSAYRRSRLRTVVGSATVAGRTLAAAATSPEGRRARSALPVVFAPPALRPVKVLQRDLTLAVDAATSTVAAAVAAGAPVGDLPSLSQRLRRAADVQHAALTGLARSRTPDPALVARVRVPVTELIGLARQVHETATDALLAAGESRSYGLAGQVADETDAIRAGLDHLRAPRR